jgi:hypothetical protein
MSLHLIKLCVGADTVKDLTDWIRERLRDKKKRGLPAEHIHTTRMMPKRLDDLMDGGSLYWVIRGEILCRQRLVAIRPTVDAEGISRCQLVLQQKVVRVEPRPCRAFQGWRYLAGKEAPPDLDRASAGAAVLPETMRKELRELGLL